MAGKGLIMESEMSKGDNYSGAHYHIIIMDGEFGTTLSAFLKDVMLQELRQKINILVKFTIEYVVKLLHTMILL